MSSSLWTRRRLAQALCSSAAAVSCAPAAWARSTPPAGERWIELVNTHTSEVVSVMFADAAGFISAALARLQYLLRDYRRDEQHPIDPSLYVQLSELATAAHREPRYELISGYRSPATNAELRAADHGVAEHSLHREGRAIDVRLQGFSCAGLRDLALTAGRGGVGYYARSDFVHLDSGRVRFWRG